MCVCLEICVWVVSVERVVNVSFFPKGKGGGGSFHKKNEDAHIHTYTYIYIYT